MQYLKEHEIGTRAGGTPGRPGPPLRVAHERAITGSQASPEGRGALQSPLRCRPCGRPASLARPAGQRLARAGRASVGVRLPAVEREIYA